MFPKTNYHSHTVRCKHAKGTEEEYCLNAIDKGYSVLGFTDHCAWPYENGFVSTYHMDLDRLEDYVAAVNTVKKQFEGKLKVHLGWECENFPAYMNWLKETKEQYGFEYLILGNHFDTTDNGGLYFGRCTEPEHLKRYVKMCSEGLETGLFSYFAHPDLCFRSYTGFDEHCTDAARELCRCAKALDIPMEYNLLGFINCRFKKPEELGYPCSRFWEIAAEEGVTCIIGTDAHSPDRFDNAQAYDNAADYLESLGLKRIQYLDFR